MEETLSALWRIGEETGLSPCFGGWVPSYCNPF